MIPFFIIVQQNGFTKDGGSAAWGLLANGNGTAFATVKCGGEGAAVALTIYLRGLCRPVAQHRLNVRPF
jgi:hypothetical protein